MKPDQPNKKSSTPDLGHVQKNDPRNNDEESRSDPNQQHHFESGPLAETAEFDESKFDESNDADANASTLNAPAAKTPAANTKSEELVGTGGATATFRSDDGASPSAKAKHPSQVGRYEIRKLIGSGAYGAVYRGWDPRLKRDVAIKLPRFRDENQANQFVEEAQRAVQLRRHAGIVPVYDVGSEGELAYIVSEFIEGGSLADKQKQKSLSIEETLTTLRTLADVVAFAHSQGWVHRDIKPSNVLIDDAKQPYLTDFGLTKRLDAEEGEEFLYGTPNYMAPEIVADVYAQMTAKPRPNNLADERVDIYALGVMLYEFLTQRTPFQGDDLSELFDNVLNETLSPPSDYNADVSPQLDAICMKALARNPDKRFLTADELHNELQAELSKVQAGKMQLAGGSPMRTGIVLVTSALLIGLIAVVIFTVGNSFWKGPQQEVEGTKRSADKSIAMNDPAEELDRKIATRDGRGSESPSNDKANEVRRPVAAAPVQPASEPQGARANLTANGDVFDRQPRMGLRIQRNANASPELSQGNFMPGGGYNPKADAAFGHTPGRPAISGAAHSEPDSFSQAYPKPPTEGRIWSTLQQQVATGNIESAKTMLRKFKAETPPKSPVQPTIERWEKYLDAIVIEDEPPSP